ncbi:MAG: L-aspartate oxidase [Phycisphaerales bacterium JB054]
MERVFDERRYLIPFRSSLLPQIFTDVLVVGAGVAGLRAAIASAEAGAEVIVLSKSDLAHTNTAWAQGGIASVMEPGDSFDAHVADTLTAGAGLCDEPIVRRVVEGGPARMRECLAWGMELDLEGDGTLDAGQEGGHSARRIYHAGGDATGAELSRCLAARATGHSNVRLFGQCFLLDFVTASEEAGSRVLGAITHHPRFGLQMIWARSTVLASGGAGVVYRETSNPHVATGDGLAAAYRAGAQLADMAFTQFHPTVLYLPGAARSLISEAVRGEGAHLLDASGRRFMPEVHELAELAPRDVVSRAIVKQLAQQGGQHVLLDCRHVEGFATRFPGISSLLANFDLDPRVDLIPVHPAAHYTVGGARVDAACRTSVPGLLAVGEASCSGLHGANRLASNSLLEGLVLGEAAGLEAVREASGEPLGKPAKVVSDIRPSVQGELDLSDVRSSLRAAMWRNVGIERTGAKLRDAVEMFDFWGRYTLDKIFDEPEGWETQNMLLVGALMARSALWREETRGCHARDDFPDARPEFLVHDCWTRGDEGPEPVPVETGELARTRA